MNKLPLRHNGMNKVRAFVGVAAEVKQRMTQIMDRIVSSTNSHGLNDQYLDTVKTYGDAMEEQYGKKLLQSLPVWHALIGSSVAAKMKLKSDDEDLPGDDSISKFVDRLREQLFGEK